MGWIIDESDSLAKHEGYAASVAPDGRTSGSSNGVGFMVRKPDEDQIERKARREGRQALLEEIEDLIPWEQMVGWQVMCTCGWTGPTWTRAATSPDRYDGTDAEDAILADGRTIDDVAYEAWVAHMEPLRTVGRVADAARALATARRDLDFAVMDARMQKPPASWAEIGRATDMSRQAARERWGGDPDPRPAPTEFDADLGLATEERLRRRDSASPARVVDGLNPRPVD